MEPVKLRNDLLIWIDLETTGLDEDNNLNGVHQHKILEVGMHITDANYNVIDKGFEIVIHHKEDDILALMNDVVRKMHTENGLIEKVKNSPFSVAMAEQMMLDYVADFNILPRSSPICGNNVGFDKNFITAQMPLFDKFLHYRKFDVSTFKELAWRQYPEIACQLQKPNKHRGLDDIQESIKELKFYLKNIFIPPAQKVEEKPESPAVMKKIKP